MMNFLALGVTLVLSQLVTMVIAYYVVIKVLTNKRFIKRYFEWVNEIIEMTSKEMDL